MKFTACVAVLLVSVLGAEAYGAGVAINFVGTKPDNETLVADSEVGVAGVAQKHWNNLTCTASDPNGHGNHGELKSVVNDRGDKVSGMSVTVDATPTTGFWPADGSAWGFSGDNLMMQLGEIHGRPRITITGIPYAKYDVYLYASAGANGGQGSASIAPAPGAKGQVSTTRTWFYNFNWQSGQFVKSTAATLDEAKKSSGSNYVVFPGNTAKSITVDWNGTLGGGWTGVSAIQIVDRGTAK